MLGVLLTFPLALAPLLLGIGAPVPIVAAGAFVGGMSIDIFWCALGHGHATLGAGGDAVTDQFV